MTISNPLVKQMVDAGYVVSPNNIHSLPGTLMYAGGLGKPTFGNKFEVQVMSDRIRVFTTKFFGEHYSKVSHWDTVTHAMFATVDDFLAACPEISEPGVAYTYNWD